MNAFRSVLLLGSAMALSACQPANPPEAAIVPAPAAPL